MNRIFLSGTALVALLAGTPAIAQQNAADACDLSITEGAEQRRANLDANSDGQITQDEYNTCLDANVPQGDRQRLTTAFEQYDQNRDAILVVAELDAIGQASTQDDPVEQQGQAAQVAVQQAPANVQVQQPAPTVRVDPANPRVAVQQPEPQVAVEQRQPQVEVTQPEPQVSVQQPEPEVEVQQPEAQVAIEQPQPQVAVNAPPPEVEVRQARPEVQVEQVRPQVDVEQPEPEVRVEQAEANVEVQAEEPRVVVEQAEPEVVIERVTTPDEGGTERQQTAEARQPAEGQQVAAVEATEADTTQQSQAAMTAGVPFDQLEGEEAYNSNGEEIGEVNRIVMEEASGDLYVVLAAGGFLGIGETELVFPYNDVRIQDNRVTIDTTLSQENLAERQDFQEDRYVEVPQDRVVR